MTTTDSLKSGHVDFHAVQIEARKFESTSRTDEKLDREMLKNRRRSLVVAHRESLYRQADALERAGLIETLTRGLGTGGALAAQLAGVATAGLSGPLPAGTLISMTWGGIAANTAGAYLVSWGLGKGFASGSRQTAIDEEAQAKVEMAQADAQLTRIDQAQARMHDQSNRIQRADDMMAEFARFAAGPDDGASVRAPEVVGEVAQEQWKASRDERRRTMKSQLRTSERKLNASLKRIEEERLEARAALKAEIAQAVVGAVTKTIEIVGYALSVVTWGASAAVAGLVNWAIGSAVEAEVVGPANAEAARARAEAGSLRVFTKRLDNTAEDERDELAEAQQHATQAEKLLQLLNQRQ